MKKMKKVLAVGIIFSYGRQPGCMRQLIHRDKGT